MFQDFFYVSNSFLISKVPFLSLNLNYFTWQNLMNFNQWEEDSVFHRILSYKWVVKKEKKPFEKGIKASCISKKL